jgi:hypothetical protein
MVATMFADLGEQGAVRPGDKVVLAEGPYQGTPGVLLRLKEDANWAEIREWDNKVRSHPVVWLRQRR